MQNYPHQDILHTHIHMFHSVTFYILYHYFKTNVQIKQKINTFFKIYFLNMCTKNVLTRIWPETSNSYCVIACTN